MRNVLALLTMLMALLLLPLSVHAQSAVPANASPISQPLIREGDLAVNLAPDLNLGSPASETEAEDMLSEVGIMPRNGWIADYPVTPDIIGELEASVSSAADSGAIPLRKDIALQVLQSDISSYSLPVTPDVSGQITDETAAPSYPDTAAEGNYYSEEGPPAVTYYAPPPAYAYLYTWVPYPFWWSNFWFPGFFVLSDFHVNVHWQGHGHDHDGFVTNHYRDRRSGIVSRVDPSSRFGGQPLPHRVIRNVQPSVQQIPPKVIPKVATPAPRSEFRGYGVTSGHTESRPNVFERSDNRQIENAASDRGFQSRTNAGQVPPPVHQRETVIQGGGGTPSPQPITRPPAPEPHNEAAPAPRSGGTGTGGFHGGGRR